MLNQSAHRLATPPESRSQKSGISGNVPPQRWSGRATVQTLVPSVPAFDRQTANRSRARALDNRKPAALGARRRLRGRCRAKPKRQCRAKPRADKETCAQHLENPPGQGINQRQNQTGGLERCIPSLNAWSYAIPLPPQGRIADHRNTHCRLSTNTKAGVTNSIAGIGDQAGQPIWVTHSQTHSALSA